MLYFLAVATFMIMPLSTRAGRQRGFLKKMQDQKSLDLYKELYWLTEPSHPGRSILDRSIGASQPLPSPCIDR